MEKVKLTREQAEAIETKKGTGSAAVAKHLEGWTWKENKCLNDLSMEQFVKALYIGYEVEETFEVGDWVIESDTGRPRKIVEVTTVNGSVSYGIEGRGYLLGNELVRHATPEEIAEEKQRRWWAKHGRDVWELREDDILEYLNGLYIVDCFDSEKVFLKSGVERKTNYAEPFDFVKKHFKVVCFAEDRKDVK